MGVVVMGVGFCGSFPTSSGLSYRELISRAAEMAYRDAGIEPEEIDGAVSVEEDLVSGYSIADEYVPDQLAMVRKPVYTICGDFMHGFGSAVMQLNTGKYRTLVVEAYSKASNILLKDELLTFAFDPVMNRLGVSPHFLAAIEMQQFLDRSEYTEGDVAEVVVRNRMRAISNAQAPYGTRVSIRDVLDGRPVATPITDTMIARHADGAVVVVLGVEDAARDCRAPIHVHGTGWNSGSSIIERRPQGVSIGTMLATKMAAAEAGVESLANDLDIVYVSDLYPHRQLMHLDAMGLDKSAIRACNPDGGSLGMGDLMEANGGVRLYDAVLQLRGEAGAHQVEGASKALVHGWRGLPTDSCAVAILDVDRRNA